MKATLAFLIALAPAVAVFGQSPPRAQTFDGVITLPNRNPPKPVSVGGVVVSDVTGQPLAGATVTLSRYLESVVAALLEETPTRDLELATESNGTFAFKDFPPGKFILSVRRDGYLTHKPGTEIVLNSGQSRSDVRIGLSPSARLNGHVRNETGQTVSGIPVSVLNADSFVQVAEGKSKADGSYSVQGFPPGNYTLFARFPAGLNGGSTRSFLAPVNLRNTDAQVADISLHAGAYAIRGRVIPPVAGATPPDVSLKVTSTPPSSGGVSVVPATASGGVSAYNKSQGTFSVTGVFPDLYVISATVSDANGQPILCASVRTAVMRSDVNGVDLILDKCYR